MDFLMPKAVLKALHFSNIYVYDRKIGLYVHQCLPIFCAKFFLVKLECSWLLASTGSGSQPSFSTIFLDAGQSIDCRMHILILLDKVQSPNQQSGYICANGIHNTNIWIELFCPSSCSDPRLLEDVFGWQLILEWIIVMHWGLSPDQVPPTVVQPVNKGINFTWKTLGLVLCSVIERVAVSF